MCLSQFCIFPNIISSKLKINYKLVIIQISNLTKMSEAVDSKKAEFKNYLQKTGAVDQLTKVLVQLYQQNERPQKAVDYIRKFLGLTGDVDGQRLQKQYNDAQDQNQKLKKQISQIKQKIQKAKNK